MPTIREEFLEWENEHGGREARVMVDQDFYVYADGATATIPAGDLSVACWGAPEPPLYAGRMQRQLVEIQRAKNVATYHAVRLSNATGEFRTLKRQLSEQARDGGCDEAELERLRDLQEVVRDCTNALKRAKRALRKATGEHLTRRQQAELDEFDEELEERAAAFEAALAEIEI